jgi:hypothetical protein
MATIQQNRSEPVADRPKPRVSTSGVSLSEALTQAIKASDEKNEYFVQHGKLPLTK